jgi:hypothetical protein
VVQLVNTSTTQERRLIVQAGAYGEHTFADVTWGDGGNDGRVNVNGKHLEVVLAPGSGSRLDIGTRCYVNDPTYDFPW